MTHELKYHNPGIYFGMTFEEYAADPSFSNSGIQNLRVSPLTYWINSPLNPDYEPQETKATEEGKAYHVRLLEGKAAFDAAYAPKLDRADYPDALASGEDLRAKCEELGLKKSGTLAEMSARIRAVDPDAQLWCEIEEAYKAVHEGKTFLPAATIRQIELAAAQVEANPEAAALLRGGFPEVSIFWVDKATGVRMKARLDYLRPGLIVDLKTFSNPMGKPVLQAVASSAATYGYGIQAHVYLDALKAVKEGGFRGTWLPEGGQPPADDWLPSVLQTATDCRFIFLFQQTGVVPNVLLREFARNGVMGLNAYYQTTQMQYRDAMLLYRECLERYGMGPWVEQAVVEAFDDTDFPTWMFN